MKPEILHKIIFHYQLGDLINFKPISGGWVHTLCELNTTTGKFFIKKLNPYLPNTKKFSQHIELTEEMGRFYEKENISAVTALLKRNRSIYKIEQQLFLVFPFIKGKALSQNEITEKHAFLVGEVLGKIHCLNVKSEKFSQPEYKGLDEGCWQLLLGKGKKQKMPWFNQLSDKLNNILLWSDRYLQAWPVLKGNNVLSHRDLTPRNVLWSEKNNLYITDWEWVGLTYPCCELLDVALNWSGILNLKINKKIFLSIVRGYRSVADHFLEAIEEEALYGCLGNWLNWVAFNIERSLKGDVQQNEFSISVQQINYTFKSLQILDRNANKILEWLREK